MPQTARRPGSSVPPDRSFWRTCVRWANLLRHGEKKRKGSCCRNEKSMWWGPNLWFLIFYFSIRLRVFLFISLISGSEDGSIVIWNPLETDETKQKRILPREHSNSVRSLSFSPDGRFLASGDQNGEIIIWSTEVRNWWRKMCHWTCAVCCCPLTTRKGLCQINAHLFHPFHFSFFSFSFIDLGAFFHRFKCSSMAHWSLVDATRLVEWWPHRL